MFKRTQEEWKQIVTDWQNSGMAQEPWCKANNVPYGSFVVHKKRVTGAPTRVYQKKEAAPKTAAEALTKAAASFQKFVPLNTGNIEIHLNGSGAKVVIARTDTESLKAVLTTLTEIGHK